MSTEALPRTIAPSEVHVGDEVFLPRFHRKYQVDPITGCWNWTAMTSVSGYGGFRFRGRKTRAHRAAWELFRGPIPDGMVIDHLCRNTHCVNPDHLEVVTIHENTMRGIGFTAQFALAESCVNGHPFDESNTYYRKGGGRACRACKIETGRRRRARLAAVRALRDANGGS